MSHKPWTKDEERKLEKYFLYSDNPVSDAVRGLDRSRAAIRGKAYHMGLTGMYKKETENKKFTEAERWAIWNKILNRARSFAGLPEVQASENPYKGQEA